MVLRTLEVRIQIHSVTSNLSALKIHRIDYAVANLSRSTCLSSIDHLVLESLQKLVTLMSHAGGVEAARAIINISKLLLMKQLII